MYMRFISARLTNANGHYPYLESVVEGVRSVEYEQHPNGTAWMRLHFAEDRTFDYELWGTAYVMNDHGKTISTFLATPPYDRVHEVETPRDEEHTKEVVDDLHTADDWVCKTCDGGPGNNSQCCCQPPSETS